MQVQNHICSASLVNVKLLRFVIYKVGVSKPVFSSSHQVFGAINDVNFTVHVKDESCEKSKEWASFNRLNK